MKPSDTHISKPAYHHGNVREACIDMALDILEQEGLQQLSLRKIAKEVGVSHNAPYRWFKTREELLVSVTIRIFEELQLLLRSILNHPSGNPAADLMNMSRVYFNFARSHPQKYRLVSGGAIENSGQYPNLLGKAIESLQLVSGFLEEHKRTGFFKLDDSMKMSIHFVSAVHGYCSLVIEERFELLGPSALNLEEQFEYTIHQLIRSIT